MLGKTLEEVRPHIPLFGQRRYTNPSMLFEALRCLGARWEMCWDKNWPVFGLARIQWEGPWMEPGAPVVSRSRWSHWVGACARDRRNIGIFDINAIDIGGWMSLDDWKADIVPEIIKRHVPRGNGGWHLTHSLNLQGLSCGS